MDAPWLLAPTAAQRDAGLPDIDWRHRPDGVVRFSQAVPSGRLAALAAGSPGLPRIVLAPGVTGSKEDFTFLLPLLAAAGYRVESYDAAGQYESAGAGPEHLQPPRRRYDYDLFVDDLLAVLRSGETPVHLLGHSFQGVVAQLLSCSRCGTPSSCEPSPSCPAHRSPATPCGACG